MMGTYTTTPSDAEIAAKTEETVAALETQCGVEFGSDTYRQIAVLLIQIALVGVRRDASIAAVVGVLADIERMKA